MHWTARGYYVAALVGIAFFVGSHPKSALSQTGAALLVKPWPDKNQVFDGAADTYLSEAGRTRDGSRFQLFDYESDGRFPDSPG